MSSASSIYTGPWVNRSQSTLLGATITLTTRDSSFLLALLAVVVTNAGQSFWNIVSYIIHQARSKAGAHDALHYQQQAILRNSGSPLSAASKLAGASFSWRKHERSKWWQFWRSRTLFLILTTFIIYAAFAVASIFSSQVSTSISTEVLIHSPDCGFWIFNDSSNSLSVLSGYEFKIVNDSAAAASYARTCYGTNNTNLLQCNTYTVPEIT